MRFRIRSILLATLLAALLFAPLAKPSQYWAMLLPAMAAISMALVTAKSVTRPDLLFWKAMPLGAFAYLFCVQFIGYFIGNDPYRGRNFWNDQLGLPLFKLLHGESAFVTNRQGLVDHDLVSFYIWIHIVAAVVLSTVAALLAHLALNWKRNAASPKRDADPSQRDDRQ